MTKKDKPYITCDPCGVQVFVRGPVEAYGAAISAPVPGVWEPILDITEAD